MNKLALLVTMILSCALSRAEDSWPAVNWTRTTHTEVGLDAAKLEIARDYALSAGGSGYITRHGKLVLGWGDPQQRYDLKSTTKSFGSIALGLAIKDGKVNLTNLKGCIAAERSGASKYAIG